MEQELEMASVDLEILRAVLVRETHDQFKDLLKTYMMTPIGWGLLGDISAYYEANPTVTSILSSDFRVWFRVTAHPVWKTERHSVYNTIFDNLFDGSPVKADIVTALARQRTLIAIKGAIDANNTEELASLAADLTSGPTERGSKLITDSVEDVITSAVRYGGLSWRLADLNASCGPISKGDLIIVGKRPETGGTSFLLSEFTHMLAQLPEGKNALIINNEEYKTKLITRLVCTALGISAPTLYSDPRRYNTEYLKFLGTKRIDVMSDGSISIQEIEKVLKQGNYGLIGINVLEKLGGISRKLEDYQRLEQLGQWGRRIALEYAPVMAIIQADASAEGVEFPDQSMLYKTKTGLQGEADLLIMLGRSPALPEDVRGLHVAKNKLPGSMTTEAKFRHIKSHVHFDIETGRFTTKTFTSSKWS